MVALAVTAAAVDIYHAPPAIFLLVYLHFQIPTATLLTHSYKSKGMLELKCALALLATLFLGMRSAVANE
jgi:hypothetical protein